MERVHLLGFALLRLILLIPAIILLTIGYWLSDLAYDAGLWPIGAVLRVALLLGLVGLVLTAAGAVIGGLYMVLRGTDR
jgi:hypothetical protein